SLRGAAPPRLINTIRTTAFQVDTIRAFCWQAIVAMSDRKDMICRGLFHRRMYGCVAIAAPRRQMAVDVDRFQ
ncbi:MAG: hypothetical protein ACRCTO_08945, partial [Pseudomonas paracarnis]